MSERHKAVPSSYLILRKEGKILLGKRCNTGYYDQWYGVPAGHVEEGELPLAGLIRECEEEIGITLDPADVALAHTMYRGQQADGTERVDFFFVAEYQEKYEPTNQEPDKCSELSWFSEDALPSNVMHHVVVAIGHVTAGDIYSELTAKEILEHDKAYEEGI